MIQHHPDDNLLAEYSAGSIAWALGLGVATHLHFCAECKARIASMNQIGAAMMSRCQPISVDTEAFTQLMANIREHSEVEARQQSNPRVQAQPKDPMLNNLPGLVAKLLPRDKPLRWRYMSPHLKMARLKTGQDKYEVGFHRIAVGGKVAEHDHSGMELTIVLKGSFSDGDGVYTPGDFLVRQSGQVHRPTAAQNEDCLCLSIVEAPVQLTGLLGKLINPFLSVRPA